MGIKFQCLPLWFGVTRGSSLQPIADALRKFCLFLSDISGFLRSHMRLGRKFCLVSAVLVPAVAVSPR